MVTKDTRFTRFTRKGVTRGYKDGLQPETLADGNWLVKQNQPVSKFAQAEAEAAVGSDASFSTCFKCT